MSTVETQSSPKAAELNDHHATALQQRQQGLFVSMLCQTSISSNQAFFHNHPFITESAEDMTVILLL